MAFIKAIVGFFSIKHDHSVEDYAGMLVEGGDYNSHTFEPKEI